MKKYRDLTPEERWEITDNLTPQDIMNGEVDHYLNDNVFWREVDYEHPDLVSFLDNRYAIINKEYGLEKLHKLSQYPRKKWEQSIAWYNHENNQNTNENKNMKQNKIKITENELKQIVAESVKKVLNEIGDTLKGQYALGAVRGRASARPKYQNNKYGGLYTKSRQDSIANNAADASWEKRKDLDINKNREMKNAEERGYYYGFEKGMNN